MSIAKDDVKEGKCYSTVIKGKPAIVRVLEVLGTVVDTTVSVGTNRKPVEKGRQQTRMVKWEYRFTIPPTDRWKAGTSVTPLVQFISALKGEVSCE